MKFKYQVKDEDGIIQKGKVEASNKKSATEILQKSGLYIVSLEEVRKMDLSLDTLKLKFAGGISKKDIAIFSRQLAVMIESRVSLVQSLLTLASQTPNPKLREALLSIAKSVEEGNPLSEACASYPKIFSLFYVSLLKSGEASGGISESLYYLSDHLEREYNLLSNIKGAMVYPVLVLCVLLVAIIIIIFGVIPPFASILEDIGGEPPFITSLMIGFYSFLRNFGWLVILALIGLISFIIYYVRTDKGKIFFDENIIKTPIIGTFLQKVYLIRFAENISTLIEAGVPITKAINITKEIIGNFTYMQILEEAEKRVLAGEKISSVLVEHPRFIPVFVSQMVKVGENTGQLQKTLKEIVGFYQKEVERGVETFMTLVEPILIIFLGVVVAFLVISVFMPLYSMIGTF